MLDLKKSMDRFEPLLGLGTALGLAYLVRSTPQQEGSVARDVVPFVAVLALLCGALSFFELP